MSWSIKLFTFRSIEVKVHLTFVLILLWAAWRWSSMTQAGLMGALFGIVATLLLFVSVTLHEFGHSLQAQKYGVSVRNITLLPLGGVAQLEQIPEDPKQELAIAISGPLVNFGLVLLLVVLAALLNTVAVVSVDELFRSLGAVHWTGMLTYLTMANLALGLFNLVPAFPMDGGRILRALLAMRMDHARATSIAVKIGQGLAFLLGLYGFMNGSFTLVLIAIFVWMGAGHEGEQAQMKSVLREMRVADAMTPNPDSLHPDQQLQHAVQLTLNSFQADFPVLDRSSGGMVGFLCESDLVGGLKAHRAEGPIEQAMRSDYPTAERSEPLFEAQRRMSEAKMRAMPVLDETGALIGLLTSEDINEAYRLLSASPKLAALQANA